MTAPRLVACWFPGDAEAQWRRLARVLAYTAAQQCSTWRIDIRAIRPPAAPAIDGTPASEHNTQKLDHWWQTVEALADGTRVLLIDADTMILRPLDEVWDRPFDVAYTVRPPRARMPFNAGVLFLRVSDRTRNLLARWAEVNRQMLRSRPLHQPWRRKYGGMNQAALGAVLESAQFSGLDWHPLPCLEWNCEDHTWTGFDPAVTRIVHVKSALRMGALATGLAQPSLRTLIHQWRRLERAAAAAEVPA